MTSIDALIVLFYAAVVFITALVVLVTAVGAVALIVWTVKSR